MMLALPETETPGAMVDPVSGAAEENEARQPQHLSQWRERRAHKTPVEIYEPGNLGLGRVYLAIPMYTCFPIPIYGRAESVTSLEFWNHAPPA